MSPKDTQDVFGTCPGCGGSGSCQQAGYHPKPLAKCENDDCRVQVFEQ